MIEDTTTSKFFSAENNDLEAVVETNSDTGSIWIKNVLEDGSFTLTIPTDSQLPSQFALTAPENNKLIIDSIGAVTWIEGIKDSCGFHTLTNAIDPELVLTASSADTLKLQKNVKRRKFSDDR